MKFKNYLYIFKKKRFISALGLTWNFNSRKNISFSVSKISVAYFMAPIDFTHDQNTIRGVIWGYTYTLNIEIHTKDHSWDIIIFTIIPEITAHKKLSFPLRISAVNGIFTEKILNGRFLFFVQWSFTKFGG